MKYEAVIGLEVHAELETRSKMFCACPVVDSTQVEPNTAVCPICTGMPGTLPVLNARAVEYALRVALALECEINPVSIFARKNYFYPDLPKGYQISQYEQPLARNGYLTIFSEQGQRTIRIRRVHLEEDTGKLTHLLNNGDGYSLVDLNRAGVPLLEIVTEPDLRSAEEVRNFATSLRSILRYLGVNSGDMQKGVMRVEPNVSVRPVGSQALGTRTEIKNLNSFRALERSIAYEIDRQSKALDQGQPIFLETMGWDETEGKTIVQRSKEEAHDYRYFPEPDLPPLVIEENFLEEICNSLPELPAVKAVRFQEQYQLSAYDADVLISEPDVAEYFEQVVNGLNDAAPKIAANWITSDLFNLMNRSGQNIGDTLIAPLEFATLLDLIARGDINQNIARAVLEEMFKTGQPVEKIISLLGLQQISDQSTITGLVQRVLEENPRQVASYFSGKETVINWLFGQVIARRKVRQTPNWYNRSWQNNCYRKTIRSLTTICEILLSLKNKVKYVTI